MAETPYTVEQHIALKRVSAVAPSPDGTWLAVAVQRLDRDGVKYVSESGRCLRMAAMHSADTRRQQGCRAMFPA